MIQVDQIYRTAHPCSVYVRSFNERKYHYHSEHDRLISSNYFFNHSGPLNRLLKNEKKKVIVDGRTVVVVL